MASPTGRKPARAAGIEAAREAIRVRGLFDSAIIFWRGTSGHAYVHTIYSLAGCPETPPASVMLVHHDGNRRLVLKVMSVDHESPSLNLAAIRYCGAKLGANEAHLHFATGNRFARQTAVFDLRTKHGGIEIVGD